MLILNAANIEPGCIFNLSDGHLSVTDMISSSFRASLVDVEGIEPTLPKEQFYRLLTIHTCLHIRSIKDTFLYAALIYLRFQ